MRLFAKTKNNYSGIIREDKLGWRDFIVKDLRDKPTRDTWGDGIFILLVGKPNGIDEFRFGKTENSLEEFGWSGFDAIVSSFSSVSIFINT